MMKVNPLVWVREHGWIQGEEHSETSKHVCTIGAIKCGILGYYEPVLIDEGYTDAVIEEEKRVADTIRTEYADWIRETIPCGYDHDNADLIAIWNDSKRRTQEEVERILGKVYGEPI